MSIKKHIPNTITSCNLLCGCIATGLAFQIPVSDSSGNYLLAFLFVILGAVFDFFDGFAARLLHVSSPIGKELDSLADDITFGLAPATIVYSMILGYAVPLGLQWVAYLAFLIAAFSALRLAKFNLDERQSLGFIGLPTPANALFWGALAVALENRTTPDSPFALYLPDWLTPQLMVAALLCGVIFSCWILVSEVPMFALKFKQYGWRGNELRYSFVAVSALLLALLGWAGFSAVIVLYVILSVLTQRKA